MEKKRTGAASPDSAPEALASILVTVVAAQVLTYFCTVPENKDSAVRPGSVQRLPGFNQSAKV